MWEPTASQIRTGGGREEGRGMGITEAVEMEKNVVVESGGGGGGTRRRVHRRWQRHRESRLGFRVLGGFIVGGLEEARGRRGTGVRGGEAAVAMPRPWVTGGQRARLDAAKLAGMEEADEEHNGVMRGRRATPGHRGLRGKENDRGGHTLSLLRDRSRGSNN
jgi:hypothetical protein